MNPEFSEAILVCGVILIGIGGGILLLHGLGLLCQWIRDCFGNTGMIGRTVRRG
jgi:hypothetical protein